MTLTTAGEIQLLPAGQFRSRDGRPADAPYWFIDGALAQKLVAAASARINPYVADYEHATLIAKKTGQPAPAAGWFKSLEWREGVGLFSTDVAWNVRAKEMIEAGEYKFISPVIGYDKVTGAVTDIYMAALTNDAAIDGMDEVLSAAALHFNPTAQVTSLTQEIQMDPLLEQLCWLLNLPVGSSADDVMAHLQKLIATLKEDSTVTAAASFDLEAWVKAQRLAVVGLSSAMPDPAKFVPIAVADALRGQVAALSVKVQTGDLDKVIADALAIGKLLPQEEAWARGWGVKDFAALSANLAARPALPALAGTQTAGVSPAGLNSTGTAALTQAQKDMCAATGLSEAAFSATLQAEKA